MPGQGLRTGTWSGINIPAHHLSHFREVVTTIQGYTIRRQDSKCVFNACLAIFFFFPMSISILHFSLFFSFPTSPIRFHSSLQKLTNKQRGRNKKIIKQMQNKMLKALDAKPLRPEDSLR
ncbi:hypothetical protein SODALDRAFT_56590 [Sodiomyces alkalinus F11]|uniref:Uncharacterized protein n=1 Tax=Sodiomyces alkalinus (strain CBS 110278 / VKM F-3762 / F11) TaxID=1314773 RepID=A0A3N2PND2_SODAK|nr:hypothetical protein SODALDRAFT_56590 [Sodiomyces alkalinus F11]ROT36028.1 hypothetical protein SODALDRAFT_56590 [Sodiomyces alkalinus F11]